jgi:hypothetical protein
VTVTTPSRSAVEPPHVVQVEEKKVIVIVVHAGRGKG